MKFLGGSYEVLAFEVPMKFLGGSYEVIDFEVPMKFLGGSDQGLEVSEVRELQDPGVGQGLEPVDNLTGTAPLLQ